jgi:hypothetical protein
MSLQLLIDPVGNNAPLLLPGQPALGFASARPGRPFGPAAAAGLWVAFRDDSDGI